MKILIAEDDEMVRELLADYLAGAGHEVQAAENGQELVRLALDGRPDLVITDMHMPEMTGDSMIAMIDMYPPLSGVPIIMVTGATSSEIEDAGIPEDITILPKPVDFAKLDALIEGVRQKHGGTAQ